MTIAPPPTDHAAELRPTSGPADPGPRARPAALLLDFGGVVFTTRKRPGGLAAMASHLSAVLARAGHRHSPAELEPLLAGGKKALGDWKNASSRRLAPVELDHRTIWSEFYGSPLPAAAREVLAGSATELQATLTRTLTEHTVRPGVHDLLALAADLGIRVGIVSNAHSGRTHRELIAEHDLAPAFAVQVYSDEVGMRKPHPGIIELAARALGTTAEHCWYVGDTYDRDVVAGRRAGVGTVVLTRDHHTDRVPFPVTASADVVLDDPRGLTELLRTSAPVPVGSPDAPTHHAPAAGTTPTASALLLDHGGVIATSRTDDEARRRFTSGLAGRLTAAGYPTSPERAEQAVAAARSAHKAWKAAHEGPDEHGAPGSSTPADVVVREIDAPTFWVRLVGDHLAGQHGPGVLDWLRAESHDLMVGYARTKSTPTVRHGVRELLQRARDAEIPVAVVSNTVCGRAVREELVEAGLDELVGAHVYSDQLGRRKPDPVTVRTALTALGAAPDRAWFVGDKPHRDVRAARAAGVGHVVLVRGGSTTDADLDAAMSGSDSSHRPDHVAPDMVAVAEIILGTPGPTGAGR